MKLIELNIISFNVPYPANYGGVIDVFYKIKQLHKMSVDVHLHCFNYGRGIQPELEKYCKSIYYYKRKTGLFSFFNSIPYIVKSRDSKKLKNNLLKNDFPILFEGLHTCFFLNDIDFKHRKKIVRAHNIEHSYYQQLAKSKGNFFKKFYLYSEAFKLKKYEAVLKYADLILAVTQNDKSYFTQQYPDVKSILMPCFHSGEKIYIQQGKGDYVLYQGNLAVPENEMAALFICNEVFNSLNIPLIIAGLNPTNKLKNLLKKFHHIKLIANPTSKKMNELIANAQLNLLVTNQPTGLKLKLLNALYNGRFCLVNNDMIAGTLLKNSVHIGNSPQALKQKIEQLFSQQINVEKELAIRKLELQHYHNDFNCEVLLKHLNF